MTPRRIRTSVLVVGTGGAGLRAAIEAAERGVPVVAVGKRPPADARTALATAGADAALATPDGEDRWLQLAADTLVEGRGLADPRMVEIVCEGTVRALADLERYGMRVDHDRDGRISRRALGLQSFRRAAFTGESTRLEIQRALTRRAADLDVPVDDTIYVTSLLEVAGAVVGAYGFGLTDGARYVLEADAVVLAAGGHSGIWPHSSARHDENTGDSMRLAWAVGARIRDAELVQFDLFDEIGPGDHGGTADAVPRAHVTLGGIAVRPTDGSTGVAGLYAVGEAVGGVHGASRLLGIDLIELLVYGRIVGAAAGAYATGGLVPRRDPAAFMDAVAAARADVDAVAAATGPESVRTLQREMGELMSACAGETRDGTRIRGGLAMLDAIEGRIGHVGVHPDVSGPRDLAQAYDLRSSAVAARATLDGAAARRETRGCHVRSDFPSTDPSLEVSLIWSGPGQIARRAIPRPPEGIARLMGRGAR